MYREFSFTSIDMSAKDRTITVRMTAEVDPFSLDGADLQLLDCSTNIFVPITYDLEIDKIVITLPYYPKPNTKYALSISGIKDIVGNALEKGINYNIVFKSDVKTKCTIVSPIMYEKVDNLIIALYEDVFERDYQIADSITRYNSFYIEIALDNLFNNIVYTTYLKNKSIINIQDIKYGQYFLRARVESGDEYGHWSDIVTFQVEKQESLSDSTSEDNIPDNDKHCECSCDCDSSDDPVFFKPLKIIGVPKDGDDCNSFYIEFNNEINTDSLDNIEVFMRQV